jgi:alkanesulfonate monooxygenase SsuD/methylene tetrahydromethanopterin reductase-like flavin-dependent oxidoreductase (luciferase family)
MKHMLFIMPTIPATPEERRAQRPVGRKTELYQKMLSEVRELAVLADQIGFDALGMTEHHFHSEGFEISVAPLLLLADLAARTKRIKFLTLGLVAPTWDPIRLAEETAVLDQLSQGRYLAGFARGYQSRWSNVLGQKYHVTNTASDGSEFDKRNREVYEEVVEIVKKAWTEETIEYKGKHFEIPFPYETGINGWPPTETTRTYGAPGELDDAGAVRRVSVVPRPYQEPHPQMFQPFSISENTIRYTAEKDIVPYILTAHPPDFVRQANLYRDVAGQHGRKLGLGESLAVVRSVHFGKTQAEAVDLLRRTQVSETWNKWIGLFGFWEAYRLPEDNEKYPLNPYTPLPRSEWTAERMMKARYAYAGTPEQVTRGIEDLHTIHGNGGKLDWFGWFFDQGLMPLDEQKRQLELYGEHVIKRFR